MTTSSLLLPMLTSRRPVASDEPRAAAAVSPSPLAPMAPLAPPSSSAGFFASPGPPLVRAAAHIRRRARKRMERESPPPSRSVLRTVDVAVAAVVVSVSVACELWQLLMTALVLFGGTLVELFAA